MKIRYTTGWALFFIFHAVAQTPLGSWNDNASRQSIVHFIEQVTRVDGPQFVPPAERIAVFDNDGTLWCEQPMYVQLAFALDRVNAMAPSHPEWTTKAPFNAALAGDLKALAAGGEHALIELVMATHTGMTSEEFDAVVKNWISTARHPKTGLLYTEMVYQPMLELLAYLREHGFKVYIVSSGGIEFMRPWSERVYGIPPEQVIGSSIKTKYGHRDGKPAIVRLPQINFIDDKTGKPVGIQQAIGRRPIAAFGNSDGDFHMLEWTTTGSGARLGVIVHHDDAVREFAYDRLSLFGHLDRCLNEASNHNWVVVSMKEDWKQIFPASK